MLALVLVVGVVVLGFVGFDCVFYVVAVMTGCGCGCGCFFFSVVVVVVVASSGL